MLRIVNDDLILLELSGIFRREDLFRIGDDLTRLEEERGVFPRRLVDAAAVTDVEVGHRDFLLYASTRNLSPREHIRTALYVESTLTTGIARMCQTLLTTANHAFEVFDDRAAACRWLGIREGLLHHARKQAFQPCCGTNL